MVSDPLWTTSTMMAWAHKLVTHQRLTHFEFIYDGRGTLAIIFTQCSSHRIEGGKSWEKELNRFPRVQKINSASLSANSKTFRSLCAA